MLASRLSAVPPSPIFAAMALAGKLKAEGKDIISLAPGEPDFNTPEHIQEQAIRAMKEGETHYTAVSGTSQLKDAVAQKFLDENHLSYAPDEIMASTGAKQILYNAFMASVNKGDEIIIPAPYWASYPDMVRLAEGIPVIIPCHQENGFKLTPEALRSKLTKKSRWLLLNSPSNPSGSVYSAAELKKIAEVLADFPRVWIISDDIYEHLLYLDEGERHATFAQVNPEFKEKTLTVNGVSKAYCMTGWRIGFCGGPRSLIKAMDTIQSQSTSCPSSIGQAAAVAALEGPKDFIKENNIIYKQRREIMVNMLNEAPGLKCDFPDGAFYTFPKCSDLFGLKMPDGNILSDDTDLCRFLIQTAGVAAVPGSAFGLPGYIRFSYATETELVREACARIQNVLKNTFLGK